LLPGKASRKNAVVAFAGRPIQRLQPDPRHNEAPGGITTVGVYRSRLVRSTTWQGQFDPELALFFKGKCSSDLVPPDTGLMTADAL